MIWARKSWIERLGAEYGVYAGGSIASGCLSKLSLGVSRWGLTGGVCGNAFHERLYKDLHSFSSLHSYISRELC